MKRILALAFYAYLGSAIVAPSFSVLSTVVFLAVVFLTEFTFLQSWN